MPMDRLCNRVLDALPAVTEEAGKAGVRQAMTHAVAGAIGQMAQRQLRSAADIARIRPSDL
jgi:hypothetical protein